MKKPMGIYKIDTFLLWGTCRIYYRYSWLGNHNTVIEYKNLEEDVNEIDNCNYVHDVSIEQAGKNIEMNMKINNAIKYEQIGNSLDR